MNKAKSYESNPLYKFDLTTELHPQLPDTDYYAMTQRRRISN
jgi:hypothetical protein